MFYVLLVVPHLLAIIGLGAFAFCSGAHRVSDDDDGGPGGIPGEQPPRAPEPEPSFSVPPVTSAASPWRRLRVGERLSEMYPRRRRRDHGPEQPVRKRLKV